MYGFLATTCESCGIDSLLWGIMVVFGSVVAIFMVGFICVTIFVIGLLAVQGAYESFHDWKQRLIFKTQKKFS